ncbi:hypothetical protein HW114_01795 [Serratia symbiotica]|uniref:hypothetical protein n=1 Tax=Serratia symbiotica TaxID=138074 RepID=UPI001328E4F1|nr:hypothetical protein [Serratia symbiotica]MBF1994343.1 hypothetical protein [Serratia symbiotica]QTP14261.1 hypothetical protein GPZ83_0013055 [Serratia symbiotica]
MIQIYICLMIYWKRLWTRVEEKISPITLGGKNTLIEAYRTARKLNINDNSTPSDRNEIINKIIFSAAKSANKLLFNLANGCVLKGQG